MAQPKQQPTEPTDEDVKAVGQLRNARERLRQEIGRVVVGQGPVLDHLLAALLCRGHALMVGVPGPGQDADGQDDRAHAPDELQPDSVHARPDAVGHHRHRRDRGRPANRPAAARVHSRDRCSRISCSPTRSTVPRPRPSRRLLQAMQEQEVSVGRRSYRLEPPFFVIATQNPIEQEGTYPLPEAQLDRFMFNILVDYPTPDEEVLIVKNTTANLEPEVAPVLDAGEVVRLQQGGARQCRSPTPWCATRSICRSRRGRRAGPRKMLASHKFLTYGASPRASQYLILGAKAMAVLSGRFHVDFADVRAVALPVLRHRLVLNFHARAEGIDAEDLIRRLIEIVPTG